MSLQDSHVPSRSPVHQTVVPSWLPRAENPRGRTALHDSMFRPGRRLTKQSFLLGFPHGGSCRRSRLMRAPIFSCSANHSSNLPAKRNTIPVPLHKIRCAFSASRCLHSAHLSITIHTPCRCGHASVPHAHSFYHHPLVLSPYTTSLLLYLSEPPDYLPGRANDLHFGEISAIIELLHHG